MVQTPKMLRTKNVVAIDGGTWPSPCKWDSRTPDATVAPTNATNHGVARPARSISSAPSGAVNAHSSTAPDTRKPPTLAWRRNGRTSIIASWLVQNGRNRFVCANATRPAAVAS